MKVFDIVIGFIGGIGLGLMYIFFPAKGYYCKLFFGIGFLLFVLYIIYVLLPYISRKKYPKKKKKKKKKK